MSSYAPPIPNPPTNIFNSYEFNSESGMYITLQYAQENFLQLLGGTMTGTIYSDGIIDSQTISATTLNVSNNLTMSNNKVLTLGTATTIQYVSANSTLYFGATNFGFETSLANRQLAINNSSGNCLRLIYNNNSGTETNYTDLLVSSSGNLNITPSGGIVYINSILNTTSTVTGGLTLGGISISATATQINYLEPIITLGVGAASGCLTLNASSNITSGINSLTATTLISTNSTLTNSTITNITLGSTLITSSGTQLNYTNVTAGTASASKCLVLDSSSNITGINSLTTTYLSTNYIYNQISITTSNLIITNLAANSGSIYTQSNLGIYTSTANKALCVNDYAGNCMRLIYNNNSGTETNYVDLKVSSGGNFIMAPSGNIAQINGDLIVTTYCTIGTASLQSYPLYVNGSVSYSVGGSTSYSGSGYGFSTGSGTTIGPASNSTSLYTTNGIVVASGQVWYLSDRRIKKEIHHLSETYGDKLIDNIKLVEYKLIKDKNNTPNIGVIAQDLLELNYKEFVNFTQNDEMDDGIQYGVDYTKLCIPIISYIRKLNKKIKFLENTFINLYPDMKGQF